MMILGIGIGLGIGFIFGLFCGILLKGGASYKDWTAENEEQAEYLQKWNEKHKA